MNYETKRRNCVIGDVDRRLKQHSIQQLLKNGLYRHYRCRAPETVIDGFDIVTWPGHLCYTGDLGTYVFARTTDMFEFMRRCTRSGLIDMDYLAQKCTASDRDGIREFSSEIVAERLNNVIEEATKEGATEEELEELDDKCREITSLCWDEGEHAVLKAMCDSELFVGCDLPSCETFTYRFVFCCYALKWFFDRIHHDFPS